MMEQKETATELSVQQQQKKKAGYTVEVFAEEKFSNGYGISISGTLTEP